MTRLSAVLRMSTRSELLSGITILSASLLMRAVALVSPVGWVRDFLGFFSVLFLVAGVGVVGVGLVHRVARAADSERPLPTETHLAAGAVIGVGVGATVGAAYGNALPVAIGTAVGAAAGIAVAAAWERRQERLRGATTPG